LGKKDIFALEKTCFMGYNRPACASPEPKNPADSSSVSFLMRSDTPLGALMMPRDNLKKTSAFLGKGNTALSQPGRLSGGERIVASARILSRRILRIPQAEAPGALNHLK